MQRQYFIPLLAGCFILASFPQGLFSQAESINLGQGLRLNYIFDNGQITSRTQEGPNIALERAKLSSNRFGIDSSALIMEIGRAHV